MSQAPQGKPLYWLESCQRTRYHWQFQPTRTLQEAYDDEGRVVQTASPMQCPRYKRYLDEMTGVALAGSLGGHTSPEQPIQ